MKLPSRNKQNFPGLLFTTCLGIVAILFLFAFNKSSLKILNFWTNSDTLVKGMEYSPFVSANGTELFLKGQLYQFTGVNAYELASLPGVNAGCGGIIPDIDGFFSSIRPNSAVRMWAYQGAVATNINTKMLDWTQLDRVVDSASSHDQKLVLVLAPQSGQCDDGHWKDLAWYLGGYNQVFNDDGKGLAPLSYIEYARAVANRYKDSTAIAMYELVSEPEPADCPAGYSGEGCYAHQTCDNETVATDTLRSFYDDVGGQIKRIDPNHLIESGVMGNGQCGGVYNDYSYIHESPGIDVASYHDYGNDDEPMPGDIYNGLQKRLDQMKIIGKPLVVGEVGMRAHATAANCGSISDRYDKFKAKMDAQFQAGIAGFIPWDWVYDNQGICTYDINPGDPLLTLLYGYPVAMQSSSTNPIANTNIISNPEPEFSSNQTPISQLPSTKLGGIDLSGYCYNLKLSDVTLTDNSWSCGVNGAPINMSLACQWQYTNMTYAKKDIAGNPYSWNCYLPPGIK